MSWANYYKVSLPAPPSARDALAAARHIVATCARPPIDLEARWTVGDPGALASLAARVQAIESPADRRVGFELLQREPRALLELLRRCPHEVQLVVGGAEASEVLYMTLTLDRTGDAHEFTAGVELHLRDEWTLASVEVRGVVVERLRECQHLGVLPVACAPAEIVERFRAALDLEDPVRRLAHGVAEDGYTLVCRSWRRSDPRIVTVLPERTVVPDPARLGRLWQDDLLSHRGRMQGVECIATAAQLGRLPLGDDAFFLELDVEVCGEPELDAMVDAAGDDPLVAAWWCGFDDWGRAYHGVRLALHGRYQDGQAHPDPGQHEVIVLVDAKRPHPGAHAFAADLAARAGIALEYVRTGL